MFEYWREVFWDGVLASLDAVGQPLQVLLYAAVVFGLGALLIWYRHGWQAMRENIIRTIGEILFVGVLAWVPFLVFYVARTSYLRWKDEQVRADNAEKEIKTLRQRDSKGLSLRIGGFITSGVDFDSTLVQVTVIASNDGEPTTASDWDMKIATANATITSHHAFGEKLVKNSLEIPRLDVSFQQPVGTVGEMPGYVSFIVPGVAQTAIDNLSQDRTATIIVSAMANGREVKAERNIYELSQEKHRKSPSK